MPTETRWLKRTQCENERSRTTSFAQSGKHRNCTAWRLQPQWLKGPRSALADGSAPRSLSHGFSEVRQHWPHLTKRAQAYIACFETTARLALAMIAVSRMRAKHFRFVLPAASDNTAAESGINRLFTTSEPLSGFLKIVAEWSAHSNVRLALTHLAGEKNVWADELSCNRTHRFAHRAHERERISLSALASPRGTATLHPQHAAWGDELKRAQHPP